jgi:hypothetical protein
MQNSDVIENLLKAENLSLEALLDNDSELIQEFRTRNSNLLRFFTEGVLHQLVNYIVKEPETDNIRLGHKYPFICNEIISCEVPELLDKFFHESELLDRLFSFLDSRQVNLTLAGYFANAVQTLLKHNSYELLSYMHDNKDLGEKIVRHLYSTSIMNLTIRILSCEDHGNPAYISKLYEMVDFTVQNFHSGSEDDQIWQMSVTNSASMLETLLSNHTEVFNWSDIQMQLSDSPNAQILFECAVSANSTIGKAATSVLAALGRNLDIKHSEENVVSPEVPMLVELFCEKITEFKSILSDYRSALGMNRLGILQVIGTFIRLNYSMIATSLMENEVLNEVVVKNS